MSADVTNRPVIITALCSALLAAGIFNIIYTFTGVYAPYGLLYSAGYTLITVVVFAAVSGIWSMEKWGVYLFLACLAVKFGLDVYAGAFNWWEIVLLVPAVIFIAYLKKMK
ncbi:MAG TPA: hypothetical protein VFX73_04045 [Chitinophagaceae bacterium]|nr:hypothetical protein [Chitinophagaceae bacterium]